ncbi:MAG: hypothetical protein ACR2N2_05595 [Acidimicrobiia bacterium]
MSWWRGESTTSAVAVVEPPPAPRGVLQVCHPEWRGVRESARAFGDPVVTSPDLADLIPSLAAWTEAGIATLVVQGWPPGAGAFTRAAANAGFDIRAVFHSAPSQHGVDAGEAEAVSEMLGLARSDVIGRVATVKDGVVPAFRAAGFDITHLENRVPDVSATPISPAGSSPHLGIFLFPMWRKNVTTQILAALELGGTAHVMAQPAVDYLSGAPVVEHGELGRQELLSAVSGMDLTLNVTLSECHPMMPMESYRLGVPCLISQTSNLFADDPILHDLTTVAKADDPHAIAEGARELLDRRDEAVERAKAALDALDARAMASWIAFTA